MRWVLLMLGCLIGLGACGGAPELPAAAPDAVARAEALLMGGDAAGAIMIVGPAAGESAEATGLLARARLSRARQLAEAAPGDPAALRAALDQLNLGLADSAPASAGAPEVGAAQAELAGYREVILALLEVARAQAVEASPTAPPAPPPGEQPAAAAPAPRSAAAAPASPRPAPAPPSYAVAQRKSFEGSGNSGHYASCIDVQIIGRAGPVGGAVVGINNGDQSYQNQTDAGGYTGRCGLGASTWSVVLFWAPPGGEVRGATTTVYLSGSAEQRAAVVFQER